jgi:hypothetical protein
MHSARGRKRERRISQPIARQWTPKNSSPKVEALLEEPQRQSRQRLQFVL